VRRKRKAKKLTGKGGEKENSTLYYPPEDASLKINRNISCQMAP
jgi:hypothetical protein